MRSIPRKDLIEITAEAIKRQNDAAIKFSGRYRVFGAKPVLAFTADEQARLMTIATDAEDVTVYDFTDCPLTQAGLYDRAEGAMLADYWSFVNWFDAQVSYRAEPYTAEFALYKVKVID